jgi:hypothetical protein
MNPRLIFEAVARNRDLIEGHLKTLMDLKPTRMPDPSDGNSISDVIDSSFTAHLQGAMEAIAAISGQSSKTNNKSTQSNADVSPIIEADFEEI